MTQVIYREALEKFEELAVLFHSSQEQQEALVALLGDGSGLFETEVLATRHEERVIIYRPSQRLLGIVEWTHKARDRDRGYEHDRSRSS